MKAVFGQRFAAGQRRTAICRSKPEAAQVRTLKKRAAAGRLRTVARRTAG
jgi:hypothetical protein